MKNVRDSDLLGLFSLTLYQVFMKVESSIDHCSVCDFNLRQSQLGHPIVGIDIAKHSLDIAMLDAEQKCASSSVAGDEEALKRLAQRLKAKGVRLTVLEATGGLEVGVMLALEFLSAGLPPW